MLGLWLLVSGGTACCKLKLEFFFVHVTDAAVRGLLPRIPPPEQPMPKGMVVVIILFLKLLRYVCVRAFVRVRGLFGVIAYVHVSAFVCGSRRCVCG